MQETVVGPAEPVLVTGAGGFVGSYVVKALLARGFTRVRCLVRPSSNLNRLNAAVSSYPDAQVEILQGNLLVPEDCRAATKGIRVIYHLAAGRDKTFAGAFANSVVGTRNLLEACRSPRSLVRFVNIGSFAVYSNKRMRRGALLDENCALEDDPSGRFEPYTFAKLRQDEIVMKMGRQHAIPYVILRLGNVFGPGKPELPGRIGIDTFGIFIHLGGSNLIPFTYVENCSEAIVLAGLTEGIDGEVINIVDDELPTSRHFLRLYKRQVRHFGSLRIPYRVAYFLCWCWELYSKWSNGQLPPAFNTKSCSAFWKGNRYSNEKAKRRLAWQPRIPFAEAAHRYFVSLGKEAST
jgi:nucleoside-diphosphate-sugar epimerase